MAKAGRVYNLVCIAVALSALLAASSVSAQVVSGGTKKNKAPAIVLPPANVPQIAPGQNLTQQQIQEIMVLRSLQSRQRRGVQTGVPQFVPFGPSMMPMPYYEEPQQPDTSQKEKRAAARLAQEEKKKADREKAEAKKAEAQKAKAAKQPKAVKKAAAEQMWPEAN